LDYPGILALAGMSAGGLLAGSPGSLSIWKKEKQARKNLKELSACIEIS
jgi:hypothetical protein